MLIAYARLVIGSSSFTEPSMHLSKYRRLTEDEEVRARELFKSEIQLFAIVTPIPGSEEEFMLDILEKASLFIQILPELCDDEGRLLAKRVVHRMA